MNALRLIRLGLAACAALSLPHVAAAQSDWYVQMSGLGSTSHALPFWSHTNRGGVYPETSGGLLRAGVSGTQSLGGDFSLDWGVGLAGYAAAQPNAEVHNADGKRYRGMLEALHIGASWKKLHLDLGVRPRETEFGGLSVTGGNLTWTGNSQAFPGYTLKSDWIGVPFVSDVVSARFDFGDYGLWDHRYVKHTLLHNQALYFRFRISSGLHFTMGLEDWCQWGGVSPVYGKQPQTLKDYLRIMTGSSGGEDATKSDQINALGNHLGRELLRLDWQRETFSLVFQHDRPFEDGSGVGFQNFPDGVNTLHFSHKDKSLWVSDILLEYVYTKWQSGTRHDRPATEEELKKHPDRKTIIVGGCDDYFNNGEYRSGWTYNGRVIGLPLFPAAAQDADGLTPGVSSNRAVAWNFGLGGSLAHKLPYTMKITYSRQFGRYHKAAGTVYENKPRQVSGAFEVQLPKLRGSAAPQILLGLYADKGSLLPDAAGATLTLRWGCKSGN
ncbi:MAG: capsule assembly Wzi family protein [Bacteroidia bacterium]|nr:capsule assembly Wzi family protein [Bacteroidia bacterium]